MNRQLKLTEILLVEQYRVKLMHSAPWISNGQSFCTNRLGSRQQLVFTTLQQTLQLLFFDFLFVAVLAIDVVVEQQRRLHIQATTVLLSNLVFDPEVHEIVKLDLLLAVLNHE
jgi:hypothetical protein